MRYFAKLDRASKVGKLQHKQKLLQTLLQGSNLEPDIAEVVKLKLAEVVSLQQLTVKYPNSKAVDALLKISTGDTNVDLSKDFKEKPSLRDIRMRYKAACKVGDKTALRQAIRDLKSLAKTNLKAKGVLASLTAAVSAKRSGMLRCPTSEPVIFAKKSHKMQQPAAIAAARPHLRLHSF